jgi:splicing factor 3B subunit 3
MACSNQRQVAIYIEGGLNSGKNGGLLVYFELDELTGVLSPIKEEYFETDIKCMDIGEVPEGRQRCKFLTLGLANSNVRMLSLEPESCLTATAIQALPSAPESVCFLSINR